MEGAKMDGYNEIGPEIPATPPEVPDISFPTETPAETEDYRNPIEVELEREATTDDTQETDQDSGRRRGFEIYGLFSEVVGVQDEPEEEVEDSQASFWDIVAPEKEDDASEEASKESTEAPRAEALVENTENGMEESVEATEDEKSVIIEKNFIEQIAPEPEVAEGIEGKEKPKNIYIDLRQPAAEEVTDEEPEELEEPEEDENEPIETTLEPEEPTTPTETPAETEEELAVAEQPAEAEAETDEPELQEEATEEPEAAPEVEAIEEEELAPPETIEIVDAVIVDEDGEVQEADDDKESQETEESDEPTEPVEPIDINDINDSEETAAEAEDSVPEAEPIQPEIPPVQPPEPMPETREVPEPFREPTESPEPEAVENDEPIVEVPQNPEIPRIPETSEIPTMAGTRTSTTESTDSGFLRSGGAVIAGGIASLFLAPTQKYETVGISVAKTSKFGDKKPTHFDVTVKGAKRMTTIRVRASDAKVAERRAKSLRSLTPWNRFRIAFRTN